jgi:hypothetical protein
LTASGRPRLPVWLAIDAAARLGPTVASWTTMTCPVFGVRAGTAAPPDSISVYTNKQNNNKIKIPIKIVVLDFQSK